MRNSIAVLVLFVLPVLTSPAKAELMLMKEVIGQYTVLESNGVRRAAGTVKVVADENGVGIEAAPIKMASDPITALKLVSPGEKTEITRSGPVISQKFHSEAENTTIRIDYTLSDGYFLIEAQNCVGTVCGKSSFTVTRGTAPGKEENLKEVLTKLTGIYKIEKAGGEAPHPTASGEAPDTLEVDTATDPKVGTIWAPYCIPPNGPCNAGNLDMPYDSSRVFSRVNESGATQYVILSRVNNKLNHYAWEIDANKKFLLQNHQFNLKGELVSLEHLGHWMGEH